MIGSIHRGQYLQRGRGLGNIFASIMRILKPIVTKSIKAGRKALSDPTVQDAVSSVKKSTIQAGTRAINKQIKKIAPQKQMSIPKAKKRIASVLSNNISKVKRARKKTSNLFNDFK